MYTWYCTIQGANNIKTTRERPALKVPGTRVYQGPPPIVQVPHTFSGEHRPLDSPFLKGSIIRHFSSLLILPSPFCTHSLPTTQFLRSFTPFTWGLSTELLLSSRSLTLSRIVGGEPLLDHLLRVPVNRTRNHPSFHLPFTIFSRPRKPRLPR